MAVRDASWFICVCKSGMDPPDSLGLWCSSVLAIRANGQGSWELESWASEAQVPILFSLFFKSSISTTLQPHSTPTSGSRLKQEMGQGRKQIQGKSNIKEKNRIMGNIWVLNILSKTCWRRMGILLLPLLTRCIEILGFTPATVFSPAIADKLKDSCICFMWECVWIFRFNSRGMCIIFWLFSMSCLSQTFKGTGCLFLQSIEYLEVSYRNSREIQYLCRVCTEYGA